MEQALAIVDHIAVAVFAVTGALVASRKQMDIFGFVLLGTVTGVGGGTLRDLLLGAPVFWVSAHSYALTCIGMSAATFFLAHLVQSRYRVLLWFDAVGLALFAVLGSAKAMMFDVAPVIAIVMGVLSATFGGIIRDVLGGESPLILRREIYVTAALIGSVVCVHAPLLEIGLPVAAGLGFAAGFAARALALVFGWSLPVYRARPGRLEEDVRRPGLVRRDETDGR